MVQNGQDPVEKWLGALGQNTAKKYGQMFVDWMRWVRENGGEYADFGPEQLIEFQKNAQGDDRYLVLDELVKPFIASKVEGRASYKKQLVNVIRSFFNHNRAPIPLDKNFRVRSETPKVVGNLTASEIRDIVLSSNPTFQAIFLSMFQGGMGLGEFEYWNLHGWKSTKRQLDEGAYVIKIDLPGRKRNRNIKPFYTFIGGDAVDKLRTYVEHHRPNRNDAIFFNYFGDPVSKGVVYKYWLRHIRKLGLVPPRVSNGDTSVRTAKNAHEIRDVFRSHWEKSPVKGSLAEFHMGHDIDSNEYNKVYRDEEWVRSQYKKAMPYLQIMSSDRPFGKVDESEVDALRADNLRLGQQISAQALENKGEIGELRKQMHARDERIDNILALLLDTEIGFDSIDELNEKVNEYQRRKDLMNAQLEATDGENDLLPE